MVNERSRFCFEPLVTLTECDISMHDSLIWFDYAETLTSFLSSLCHTFFSSVCCYCVYCVEVCSFCITFFCLFLCCSLIAYFFAHHRHLINLCSFFCRVEYSKNFFLCIHMIEFSVRVTMWTWESWMICMFERPSV